MKKKTTKPGNVRKLIKILESKPEGTIGLSQFLRNVPKTKAHPCGMICCVGGWAVALFDKKFPHTLAERKTWAKKFWPEYHGEPDYKIRPFHWSKAAVASRYEYFNRAEIALGIVDRDITRVVFAGRRDYEHGTDKEIAVARLKALL